MPFTPPSQNNQNNKPEIIKPAQDKLGAYTQTSAPVQSAYQQNLSQPVNDKWYAGDTPTTREIYGRIYDISQSDPETANMIATGFAQAQRDPSSPWYAPYSQATNQAVSNLQSMGFDTNNLSQEWVNANRGWIESNLIFSGTTNSPTKPGKKATADQLLAYQLYQWDKSENDTQKAEKEWTALQEEASYLANDKNHNYSSQDIINMIYGKDGENFSKKYPMLASLDSSLTQIGGIRELNRGINYSKDGLNTVIWRARNGGGTGNWDADMALSTREGNQWQDNPEISAKLNWNDEENYSPYSVGMTAGEEGRYFDVYEFTPEKIEELRSTLDTNDETAMKMFDNVVAAEETTVKAETEREDLMGKVDGWIKKGYSAKKIMEKVDSYLDKKCPTLRAMDKSMKSSDQKLIKTTRAINYKYEDLKKYVEGKANNFSTSGAEETDAVLSRAGEMWRNKFSPQQIETDKTETAALSDYVAAMEDELTEGELAHMTNASSSSWGDMRDSWDEFGGMLSSGEGVSKEFALAQMEAADKEYTASAFKSAEVIADYESKQQQYDNASAQYEQLSKQYGDQAYVGVQINPRNRVNIDVDGKPVNVWINKDDVTGQYVFGGADFTDNAGQLVQDGSQKFRDYIGNEEEFNSLVEQKVAEFNEYAQNVDRVASEGVESTQEGQDGLQQMYAAKAIMDDTKTYLDENRTAYDEAVKAEQQARDKYARSYRLLDEHGANTDGGKTHLAMFDFALQYGRQKPEEVTGTSDIGSVDELLREDADGKYSYGEFSTAAKASINEINEQIADIQFLMEYFGDELPKGYVDNMNAQISELEWKKEDYAYFLLQESEDWDQMVAKGYNENPFNFHEMTLENLEDSSKYGIKNWTSDIKYFWDKMTPEEQERFNYLLGKGGFESAEKYFNHLNENGMLDIRRMDDIRDVSRKFAEDNVVAANLLAIGTAPLSALGSLYGLIYTAATGKSASNKEYMVLNNFANEVNQKTNQMIQGIDNEVARTLVQGAYEIVYNRGRSAMNAIAFPGLGEFGEIIGAAPMAVTAMADKVMELKDSGATDAQAWLLGTITLMCEAGTEAIELKDIKAAKELGLNKLSGIKDFLKQYPIAGLNEALGESLNDIIENAADRIIMGDESEFAERVWHYRTTMGMSQEDAEAMAYKDEIYNVMHTAIVSFLTPGLDVMSFASGKTALYDHYRRQAKEYDMSIRDIRNAEQTKARYAEQEGQIEEKIQNAPSMEYESQTREATIDRYAKQEADLEERVTSVPTLNLERAERETTGADENAKSYQTDMEILETAKQTTDPNARSSAVASTIKTGDTEADSDIANAAAVKIDSTFENGIEEVQDLMDGGLAAGVDAVTLKKGIQYATLGGEDSACNRVVNSDEYRNATPDKKAKMLADAAELDENNRKVWNNVYANVRGNLIAEQEAILGRDRKANEAVTKAEETLKAKESEQRDAQNDLDAKYDEMKAINDSLQAALREQANNPRDDNLNKTIESIIASIPRKNEEIKEYEQRLENKKAEAEKARTDLENTRRDTLANNRKQAEAVVNQKYIDREAVEQQRAEQAKKDAEVAEQARQAAQELNNFSRLNAEELVDQQFPNISREDRARAIRIYQAVQASMSNNVQSIRARKDFTNKLAKKYGLTVKEVKGGLFNARIDPNTKTLYVNANTNQSDVMYAILLHEITHPAENAKDLYTELADAVLQIKYGDGITYNGILEAMKNGDLSSKLAQDILGKKNIYDKVLKKNHSYEEALQEIVADGVGYVIAGDQNAIDQIVAEKPNLARRILASIKNFIQRMAGIEGEPISQAQKIADMLEKSIEATWGGNQKNSISAVQPLVEDNDGNVLAEELRGGTVAIDTDKFSLNSFDAEEQIRVIDALKNAKNPDGTRRFTDEEIDKYMIDATGIAKMIADDRHRLDFEVSDPNKSMMKSNSDYGGSIDASTLCAKRLVYQGTFDAIQHLMPNTPLMPEDLVRLTDMMREMGYETPCGICYVESRRKNLDSYIAEWLETFKGTENDSFIPQIADVSTTDGLENVRKKHPETYKAFMKAMNAHGQQNNPKVVQLRTEYKGEIRNLKDDKIQSYINHGGIRLQSFSDFETPHLLDMIQVIYDISSKNLTSQAYTKVPNFAWAFGDTGVKINLSLIGKGSGVDENGNLIFDDVEGMPFEEAMKLRNRYSKNVGTILVGMNDKHILAAMADPNIDYIIPFHSSGWKKDDMKLMHTISGYDDYTMSQNEKEIATGRKAKKNLEPVGAEGYWDFNKSGKENAEAYLALCKKNGLIPKFSQFLVDNGNGSYSLQPDGSTDGYWKLLIDFKMYDNDGVGSPQTVVTPNVNMPEAIRILNEYDLKRVQPGSKNPNLNTPAVEMADNNSLPVAQPVVDRFVEEYKANHPLGEGRERYSISDTWNFDEEFDRMISEMSSEELNEMFEKEFGFPLNNTKKEDNSSNELLNGVTKEQAAASAIRDLEKGYAQPSDGEYFNAVINGDTATAQKMVDDKAKAMGYTLSGIHRTNAKFTVFEKSKRSGANGKSLGDGFYISSGRGNEYDSDDYGKNRMRVYVNLGNVFDTKNGFSEEEANKIYDKYFAPVHKNAWEGYKSHVLEKLQSWTRWMDYVKQAAEENGTTTDEVMKWLGYDSIKDGPQYAVFDSNQIKLADAVTYHDDGTPVSLSERFDQQNQDIRYSISDNAVQMDKEYQSVIRNGRYDLAEKMVDEAAKEAGYTIKAYHGTPNGKFNQFLKSKVGTSTDFGKLGRGFYFSTKKQVADYYAGYLNSSTVMPVYLKLENPFVLDHNYDNMTVREMYDSILGEGGMVDERRSEELTQWLVDHGYDGIVADNEYMVLNPENIKSAETITYDNDGNVIPLSERFRTNHEESWKNNDIRYSLPSDAPYLSAVDHGNMEEAQRLVDEKAKEAGYTKAGYHGTLSGGFTVFDKSKAGIGGNSGAGFYFSNNLEDSNANYSDVEGADNWFKANHLADKILEEFRESDEENFEYEGYEITEGMPYDEVVEIAKKILTKNPQTYNVYLDQGKVYVRDFNNSTNLIEDAINNFDESLYDPNDYDNEDDYYDELSMARSDEIYEAISNAVYKGIADVESHYEIFSNVNYDDIIGKLTEIAMDYETLTWNDLIKVLQDQYIDIATEDMLETTDGSHEIARAIVEAFGYDSIEDREVSKKFNQLKNMGNTGDTVHYIMFRPEQIKLADTVTYDNDGNVIPLSERFKTTHPDIRYSLPSDDILEEQFRFAIENGEDIPTITQNIEPAQEEKERQWGREGLQRSEEIAQKAKDYVLAHNKYYPDTNSEQIDRAIEWIRSQKSSRDPDGYNTAFQKVTSPNYNFRSADGQARMIAMMGMAVAKNDVPGQVQLADVYNKQGTTLGQALQARKLWKLMTPEGRQSSLDKMLNNAQDELKRRGIDIDLSFSNWVYMAAAAATEDGDMQRVYQMAGQELAKQMPANWKDKIRSLRMLAMLGNPRTHFRNYIGNALFVPAVGLKNKLGAMMELRMKPGERTKTTSLFLSNEARAFAQEDVNRMKDELTGEAKYNEMNAYQKEQKAFKGLLQAVIDYNSNKLEKEDWKFLRGHYIRALGGWMMANGYTAEQLQNNASLLEKGRAYAIQEAQKATYRDFSKLAATLNKVSREGGVAGFVVDAVLPFKKTPANILKRGIEYSPVGLMRSLTTDIYHLKQWNDAQDGKLSAIPEKALSPTQFIDRLCSGLSGTAIAGVGMLLSAMGLVTCGLSGGGDDDLEKDKGNQQYSIKILGTDITYTMDWAAPMSMPFFVGAAIQEQLHEQDGFDVEDILDAMGNISEPVFNLSMLDGVNTLFKTSQYDDTNTITQIAAKIGSNYVTSYVPSLLSAITKTLADDTRRKAFVESGKGTGVLGTLRYAWEQTENKLPIASQTNIPYRDVWGNPEKSNSFGDSDFLGFVERAIENFISPGYISNYKNDPILNEMGRLYDSTHDKDMIPSDPPKSLTMTIGGEKKKYVFTDKEWDAYKVARGQAAFEGLTELMSMIDYKSATDDVQAKMIKEVWDYADDIGKSAVIPEYRMEDMGYNPIATVAHNSKIKGYEEEMVKALKVGDYDAYETMIEALHENEVEDSAIKTKIGNAFREKYKKAYLDDDFATMAEIEDILDYTDFDFDLEAWEEKADEKYGR